VTELSALPSPSDGAYHRLVARLGIQAALALEHAHQLGVLHRDIKPGNLLLDEAGQLWITDFGLAQVQSDTRLTMTGDVVGTLRYMSPEQALARRGVVDHRTDIYSLGATLYELLTLQPAFSGSDGAELLRQVACEEPLPPRRLNRAVPRELETIVLKALDKDPAQRYASAQELAEDLERFLNDEPIQARRPTPWQRLAKCAKRHRGIAWMGVVLLAILALGSTLSTVFISRQLARAEQAEEDRGIELQRALRAEGEATNNLEQARRSLWLAKLGQAQAGRWSGRAGRAFDSLKALAEAAQIARSLKLPQEDILKLRNEAIACLALPDLRRRPEFDKYTARQTRGFLDGLLQRYATSDGQGNITIRRIPGNREIVHLKGPGASVWWLDFSPDGQFLAAIYNRPSASRPGHVLIWDLARGEIALRLPPEFTNTWIWLRGFRDHGVWSPDSRRYAIVVPVAGPLTQGEPPGTIGVYDVVARKEIRRFTLPTITRSQVAFDPSGKQLAVLTTPGVVQVRDVDSGRLLDQITFPAPAKHFTWGCDGRFLAATYAEEDTAKSYGIYLWDVPGRRMHKVLEGHRNVPIHLAFNRGGDLLASNGWDGTLRLWNPRTGKELLRTEGDWGTLHFSRDDRFLMVGVGWSAVQRCWEVKTGRESRELHTPSGKDSTWLGSVGFSADGKLLASEGGGGGVAADGVRLWDVVSARHLARLGAPRALSLSADPNGQGFTTPSSGSRYCWPFSFDQDEAGRKVRIGPPRKLPLGQPSADSADGKLRSPDGKWAVSASGFTVSVWDARSGKRVRDLIGGHPRFSPDGKWLVTTPGQKPEYVFWQVGSWKPGFKLPHEMGYALLALSPDARLVAFTCNWWEGVRLVDYSSGRPVATLATPCPTCVTSLAISRDGRHLAVGTAHAMIQLWDLRAIRRKLSEMDLDWDLSPYPASPLSQEEDDGAHLKPLRVEVDMGELAYLELRHFEAVKDAAGCRAAAESFERLKRTDAGNLYNAACYRAIAAAVIRASDRSPGAAGRADAEATRAVAWLRQAVAAGYRDTNGMRYDSDLDALRDRTDFGQVLGDVLGSPWLGQGTVFAERGEWARAVAAYARAFEKKPPDDPYAWFEYACLCVQVGDVAGYRKLCGRMRQRFGASGAFDDVGLLTHACVLAPDALGDARVTLKLAWQRLARSGVGTLHYPWSVHLMGLAYYRGGQDQQAIEWLTKGVKEQPTWEMRAFHWLVLAMTHHRLGRGGEARKWFDKADKWIKEAAGKRQGNGARLAPPGWQWRDWLLVQLFRREAAGLLKKPFGARVPDSRDRPGTKPK
jgi:WD40 repeat protein/tetratricopeptide (TPR) repeat protein